METEFVENRLVIKQRYANFIFCNSSWFLYNHGYLNYPHAKFQQKTYLFVFPSTKNTFVEKIVMKTRIKKCYAPNHSTELIFTDCIVGCSPSLVGGGYFPRHALLNGNPRFALPVYFRDTLLPKLIPISVRSGRCGDIRRSSASPRPPCVGTPSASVWPSPRHGKTKAGGVQSATRKSHGGNRRQQRSQNAACPPSLLARVARHPIAFHPSEARKFGE